MIHKETYSFSDFFNSLRTNEDKRELIENYEACTGAQTSEKLEDQKWYSDYLTLFNPLIPFGVPDVDFFQYYDIGLLQQLVAGSFSSDLDYSIDDNGVPQMVILVQNGDQVVRKNLGEVMEFQLRRLFDIFFEEYLNLEILIHTDETEARAIMAQRSIQLQKWNHLSEAIQDGRPISPLKNITQKNPSPHQQQEKPIFHLDSHSSTNELNSQKKSFNYASFIKKTRNNDSKREFIEKYESLFGAQSTKQIEDQKWYADYLSKFDPLIPFDVPKADFFENYDLNLLQQLVGASFSSILDYEWGEDSALKMVIHVQSGEQFVSKRLDELWDFQIERLYEIYLEELMNLEIFIREDEDKEVKYQTEKDAILRQRTLQFHKWQQLLDLVALKHAGLEVI